jgi:hypothetical protein
MNMASHDGWRHEAGAAITGMGGSYGKPYKKYMTQGGMEHRHSRRAAAAATCCNQAADTHTLLPLTFHWDKPKAPAPLHNYRPMLPLHSGSPRTSLACITAYYANLMQCSAQSEFFFCQVTRSGRTSSAANFCFRWGASLAKKSQPLWNPHPVVGRTPFSLVISCNTAQRADRMGQ